MANGAVGHSIDCKPLLMPLLSNPSQSPVPHYKAWGHGLRWLLHLVTAPGMSVPVEMGYAPEDGAGLSSRLSPQAGRAEPQVVGGKPAHQAECTLMGNRWCRVNSQLGVGERA